MSEEKKLNLVGYCGINCSKCEIYIASTNNDEKVKQKLVEDIKYFTGLDIKSQEFNCLGCRHPKSKHKEFMGINCELYKCASKKDPISCGHCSFYPCKKIKVHFKKFSLKPLKAIRKSQKKLLKIGNELENLDKWIKKEKKV